MTRTTHAAIRTPGHVFADEIVVGDRIIPPGRVRAVEIIQVESIQQAHSDDPETFYFIGYGQGPSLIRMHRSEQAKVA